MIFKCHNFNNRYIHLGSNTLALGKQATKPMGAELHAPMKAQ